MQYFDYKIDENAVTTTAILFLSTGKELCKEYQKKYQNNLQLNNNNTDTIVNNIAASIIEKLKENQTGYYIPAYNTVKEIYKTSLQEALKGEKSISLSGCLKKTVKAALVCYLNQTKQIKN